MKGSPVRIRASAWGEGLDLGPIRRTRRSNSEGRWREGQQSHRFRPDRPPLACTGGLRLRLAARSARRSSGPHAGRPFQPVKSERSLRDQRAPGVRHVTVIKLAVDRRPSRRGSARLAASPVVHGSLRPTLARSACVSGRSAQPRSGGIRATAPRRPLRTADSVSERAGWGRQTATSRVAFSWGGS